MEQLTPYFETELALLRRNMRGFAERYPALAGKLELTGDTCKDPHVERMIQATALLAARVAKRMDDDYPQFTESLLEMLYPHYLRSFPPCSIAQLDLRNTMAESTEEVITVPRGVVMKSLQEQGVKCLFTTASEVLLAPLVVTGVRFDAVIDAPPAMGLGPGVSSSIAITLSCAGPASLDALALPRLRLFIDGDPLFCAALRNTLFMRVACACLVLPGQADWCRLARVPLRAAGFSEDEALVPSGARSHPAYRLLTEYFAFPEKFNFVDLDWPAIAALLPPDCRSVTLQLALANVSGGSHLARTLGSLGTHHLLPHCVPVVNLFKRPAAPVSISHTAPDYALLADAADPAAYEIYDVLAASLVTDPARRDGTETLQPFYGGRHRQAGNQPPRYWVTRRDPVTAELSPGHETRIALVDQELASYAPVAPTLSVELLCSNRDLPSSLPYGQPDGDLALDGTLASTVIRLLRKPTASCRFETGNSAHWRLVAHLSLNHRALSSMGLEEFRTMLALYDLPRSLVTQRHIQGVVDLHYRTAQTWVGRQPHAALMPGVEIRVTLDEAAFVGGGIHLFVQVLDHFFGLYGQINVYSQLVVLSKRTGDELWKCPPRSADQPLE
ncbi:type VI secretion system baseplate subunit TssF [Duganella sp. LX20W]|uniref:Type VI secretion system baseplate subunit TssF n=1 Tax=Rugamonas brunnea TaxID=2758569 RepID=A0A7W2EWC0_9BURK|nr:type VI secretion system baseplate subunit TssF [Rugamonas brunnea]MBA5639781.1 type VI secretion system baseplate subunit TssF [Rugamonas brunnea]